MKKIKRPDKYTPSNFNADDLLMASPEVLRKANERLEREARDTQVVNRIGMTLGMSREEREDAYPTQQEIDN